MLRQTSMPIFAPAPACIEAMRENSNDVNGLTAIVCCHNSSGVVVPTLQALAAQSVPAGTVFEILVVDNACSDDTVTVAHGILGPGGSNYRIVREDRLGLIHARIAGVRAARTAAVLFVDDDNILGPGYVERVLSLFSACPDVGVIGGYAEPYLRGNRVPLWFLEVQGIFACGPQRPDTGLLTGRKQYLYGAGLAFRAGVLRAALLGSLPPVLTGRTGMKLLRGDDTELCYRSRLDGAHLYYDERLRLRHNIDARRVTWKNVCTMRRQTGATWILLNIYDRLILGMQPPTITYMWALLAYRWARLFVKSANLLQLPAQGRKVILNFHFLIGMTRSLLLMGRQYMQARESIMRTYGHGSQPWRN